jgi:chloroplast NAD(P)H dehydrogenase
VYENVKQATAFGMKSVVYVPRIKPETVSALSALCDKATMGCLVAPTLSIGSILLQQAVIMASFHYNNVELVESRPNAAVCHKQKKNNFNFLEFWVLTLTLVEC